MNATLSFEMLDEFNMRVRSLGGGLADSWAPGTTDARIDELLLPLGIDLPEEARIWWRWHNGTIDGAPVLHRQFNHRSPLNISETAGIYAAMRPDALEAWGREKLLDPMGSKPRIYFDCNGERDQPVPVRTQHDIEDPDTVLASIGELIQLWIKLLDLGVWRSRPDGGLDIVDANIPPEIRPLGIV